MATATFWSHQRSSKPGPARPDRGARAGLWILALVVVWTVANAIADWDRFLGSLLVGLQNGLLYALIALGYTMVYGIIELINFAHGDLFMLATIVAAR